MTTQHNAHCINKLFDFDYSNTLPIPVYWVLISDILYGAAVTLVVCSTLDLFLLKAQTRCAEVLVGVLEPFLVFFLEVDDTRHCLGAQPLPAVDSATTWYNHYTTAVPCTVHHYCYVNCTS